MIIVKSPLRISFVGGGSDLPSFCHDRDGHVISAAIDRYVYISISPRYKGIRISYSKTENVDFVSDIQHDIIREAIELISIPYPGVEIVSIADLDSGSGLGSSGAFTTALVKALQAVHGRFVDSNDLFKISSLIEMSKCRKPIGYQDQAASSFGGIGFYTFRGEEMSREDVSFSPYVDSLFDRLLLVDTNLRGSSSDVLGNQCMNISVAQRMSDSAELFRSMLFDGQIDECGELLKECWSLKKSICKDVTNETIDNIYSFALSQGAIGGKICGAGGRGFMVFITREDCVRPLASHIFDRFGLRTIIPHLCRYGTRVVYSS